MKRKTIEEQADKYYDSWNPAGEGSFGAYIIKAERARVRRMVKKMRQFVDNAGVGPAGYIRACDDILAKLKEGR